MSNTRRLTAIEKQELEPFVKEAQHHAAQARANWDEVGALLDKFGSHGHSQCCPIGGMRTGIRNSCSGETPCPCGWGSHENVEDVLRRMITLLGARIGAWPDPQATSLIADGLAALNRVKS